MIRRVWYCIVGVLDLNWILVGVVEVGEMGKELGDMFGGMFLVIVWKCGNEMVEGLCWIELVWVGGGKE